MLIDPMYYAVFYDVTKPKDDRFAMRKRINYFKYINLTDGMEEKTVELDGVKYKITEVRSFKVINPVDNTLFLVCDVEKVKP